jgi:glycosyltransferase involved in cell wall biosynthesis
MPKRLRVAMIAPPWLPIPPVGYGGIENVIYALVPALIRQGVDVELFTIKETKLRSSKKHWLHESAQYEHIHKPQNDAMPILTAHVMFALNAIRQDGGFDIIHDHNEYIGPMAMAFSGDNLPPAVHTIHGPPFTTPDRLELGLPDNRPWWREIAKSDKIQFVPISHSMANFAPRLLKQRQLDPVHNMLDVDQYPFVEKKSDYFITLARFHPDKGQHLAIEACLEMGHRLQMAGAVAGISQPRRLLMELANPLSPFRGIEDFRYYSDKIFPHVNGFIKTLGEIKGARKLRVISRARALLFPIQWDEPFGMAPIEALACGTPVIAMNRGALPEIIDHGVNGFLANDFDEFKEYMKRIDEINPEDCRASVKRKFSADFAAKCYINRYKTAIALAQGQPAPEADC